MIRVVITNIESGRKQYFTDVTNVKETKSCVIFTLSDGNMIGYDTTRWSYIKEEENNEHC